MVLICIDPGHGGKQPGAVRGGMMEKDATLQIARMVARILKDAWIDVIMTRNEDIDVSLPERCDISNKANADAFVSIHLNAHKNTSAHGLETWKWHRSTSDFADKVQNALIASTGAKDRGVRLSSGYYVIKHTKAPALVVECGFMSNDEERELLFDKDYQRKLAEGIASGIIKTFKK